MRVRGDKTIGGRLFKKGTGSNSQSRRKKKSTRSKSEKSDSARKSAFNAVFGEKRLEGEVKKAAKRRARI